MVCRSVKASVLNLYAVSVVGLDWSKSRLFTQSHTNPSQSLALDVLKKKWNNEVCLLFLRFCQTWTKRYLITSQTRVKCVSRIHHRTIFCTPPPPPVCFESERISKKTLRVGGLQSPFSISSFILFFVLLPFFLKQKPSFFTLPLKRDS